MYKLAYMFRQNLLPLSLICTIPLLSLLYDLLNNPNRGVNFLITDLDRNIPFLKIFVLPYAGWYFFVGIALFLLCIRDRSIYYTTMISIDIGLLICYTTYFFFQTTVPRPALTGDDIFIQLLAFIYASDPPYNCFPSIHCLISYLIMKAYNNCGDKKVSTSVIINGIAVLIIISTLFVKQHVVLDAISAILLGDIIFNLIHENGREIIRYLKKKSLTIMVFKKKLGI